MGAKAALGSRSDLLREVPNYRGERWAWLQNRFRGKPYEVLGRDIEISLHVSLFGLIFRQIKGENHEAPL